MLEKDFNGGDDETLQKAIPAPGAEAPGIVGTKAKPIGVSRALQAIIYTDFFSLPFFGILAKMRADNKFIRTNEINSNRFAYLKP